jgi:hypothetical protein
MIAELESALGEAQSLLASAGEPTEFAGLDGFKGAGGVGNGDKGGRSMGAGGALGSEGIGAGGKTPRLKGPSGVNKIDTIVRGTKGAGPEMVRPLRAAPDRADPHSSYYSVYPSARRAAEDALSKEQVPAGYRKPVKEYFDSIAQQ